MERRQCWDRVKQRIAREGRLEIKEHYLGSRHIKEREMQGSK